MCAIVDCSLTGWPRSPGGGLPFEMTLGNKAEAILCMMFLPLQVALKLQMLGMVQCFKVCVLEAHKTLKYMVHGKYLKISD